MLRELHCIRTIGLVIFCILTCDCRDHWLGSSLGKEKNIKRGKRKIGEPLLADFLSCLLCLQALDYILKGKVHQACACAFKEEERSVLVSVTLKKGTTGSKVTVPTIGITFCM